jgi:hypothetical protein
VQVSFKTQGELHGQGAKLLLERIVERLRSNFADFTFVQFVTETTVDGQPAAGMAARYTVADGKGKEFKTLSRMWAVPRGDYMLTIGMYSPAEGPNVSEKEFETIFKSIKLSKP